MIQRYEERRAYDGWLSPGIYPSDTGEWVDYDDHLKVVEELKAELESLTADDNAYSMKGAC